MSTMLQTPTDFKKQEQRAQNINRQQVDAILNNTKPKRDTVQGRYSRKYQRLLKIEAVNRGMAISELLDEFIEQGLKS